MRPTLNIDLGVDTFSIPEFVAFAMIGYMCGILGAIFTFCNEKLLKVRNEHGSFNVLGFKNIGNPVIDKLTGLFEA